MNTSPHWYQESVARLAQLRSALETVRLVAGVVWFAVCLIGLAFAAVCIEMVSFLDQAARTWLVGGVAVLSVAALGWLVGTPLLRRLGLLPRVSDAQLARLTGNAFPEIRDRLLNALELHDPTKPSSSLYSVDLIDVAGTEVARDLRPLELSGAVDRLPIGRSLRSAGVLLFAVALVFALFPGSFSAATARLLHYSSVFTPANAVAFSFEPADSEILKGSTFSTTIRLSPVPGANPPDPRLSLVFLWKPGNQAWADRIELLPDSPGVYRATLGPVREGGTFGAEFNSFESAWHRIGVVDPPLLRSFSVRLDYPRYSGLPPRLQDEFVGDIAALPGTIVTLTGTSTNDIHSARVRFSTDTSSIAQIRGRSFTVRFPVLSASLYSLDLQDTRGLHLADPITYRITLIEDKPPVVQVLQPGRNLDISDETVLPFLVRIADDYGFSSLRLSYRLVQSRYEPPWAAPRLMEIPLPASRSTSADVPYVWSLDALDLVPEDVLQYSFELFDNDDIRGPKSTTTPLFLLRLPSLDEIFADAETTHRQTLDDMQRTLKEAQELGERLQEIEQDLRQDKPSDWQRQKNLEELSKQYQDIDRSIRQVQERLEQMVASMDQRAALSPETLEKYIELQEMFEQLNSEELRRALQQLQQAMQNVDRQQLQQALQRLSLSEEHLRESLERTINLLKRIQIEQKLDEALRRSEELYSHQEQLRDTARQAPGPDEQLAPQQQGLEQDQRHLEAAMRDLEARMGDFFSEMPLDKLEELNRRLGEQRIPAQMNLAAAQLRSGDRRSAGESQDRILDQLQSLTEDLRAIQEELLRQQSQYAVNALRQATLNLLDLSRRQEGLKNESAAAQGNSPALRQNAQNQIRALEALAAVAQSLSELGQRSFAVTPEMASSISEAFRGMQNALRALDGRNAQGAARSQTDAMAALNASAKAAQDALDAMMKAGSGGGSGGLLQQLQTLAGQQQDLNARTQSLEAAAQAARLAAEQAAIQKSLEQLNREAQRATEGERLLGDLKTIAQEMQEVVRSLEQEQINPETLRRQERILSRMLDASRSLREHDFEKRRKATTGTPFARPSPPELETRLQADRLRQDLLRALEQGYSQEYEQLIRKYFEALRSLESPPR